MSIKIKNFMFNLIMYAVFYELFRFELTKMLVDYVFFAIIVACILLILADIFIFLNSRKLSNSKNSLIQKRISIINEFLLDIEKDVSGYNLSDGKMFFGLGIILYLLEALIYREFFNFVEVITLVMTALSMLKMLLIFINDEIPELLRTFKFIGIIVERIAEIKAKNIYVMTILKNFIYTVLFALTIYEMIN